MLSSVARSPYICLRCQFQLVRSSRPWVPARPATSLPLPPARLLATYSPLTTTRNAPPKRTRAKYDIGADQIPGFSAERAFANVDSSIAELLDASAKRAMGHQRAADEVMMKRKQNEMDALREAEMAPKNAWEATGLKAPVAQTLLRAFPNATRVTPFQRKLLHALLKGHSATACGQPGCGKSFAITAWLLSLPRATTPTKLRVVDPGQVPASTSLTTTALIITPNVDLAKQYHANISRFLEATGSAAIMSQPHAFVQAVFRGEEEEERMELLRRFQTPHILVATPTILLDILSSKDKSVRDLVDYNSLKAIVVEEADSALSRYENPIMGEKSVVDPNKPKDPLLILLDYIFEARKVVAMKAGIRPTQPQLVIPSSTTGTGRLFRTIKAYHPSWLDGENRPGFAPFTGKGITTAASTVACIGNTTNPSETDTDTDRYPLKVSDTISHHIVAYDPTSGFLRDAPVPVYKDSDTIDAEIEASGVYEREVEAELNAALADNALSNIDQLLRSYGGLAPEIKRRGYPPDMAAEILESLLSHDDWPRDAIAIVGENASRVALLEACQRRGITARLLDFDTWNDTAVEERRPPLGRTDLQLTLIPTEQQQQGRKEETKVWIANYHSLRGLDVPGVNHTYILHRLDRVREYITYAGRVGRWPLSANESLRDPRFMGQDPRPRAKVVTVVLEERGAGVAEGERPYSSVAADGSEAERWAWRNEALRLAKIGATVQPYFGSEVGLEVKQEEEEQEQEEEEEEGLEEVPKDQEMGLDEDAR